jgi:hypothetical protein
MAITINLSNVTVDLDAETGTLVDGTTFTSPVRSGFGVFVKVYKVDYNGGRVYLTTTPNSSDPEAVTQWTWAWDTDGWHQIFYVAVPDWAATTYAKYDAVFDDSANIVYRSKVNSNTVTVVGDLANTTNWEVISDPTSLCLNVGTASASANLNTLTSITTGNVILYPETLDNFEEQTGLAFLEQTSSYKRSEDVRLYELLGLACDGMEIANTQQEYALGELYARRAISLCSNC